MSITSPILLILGYGSNVGKSVAQAFISKGYKVAVTSRKAKEEDTENQLNISADLSDPKSIAEVFSQVKSKLGFPSVVVYNASAGQPLNDPKNIFSVSLDDFVRDTNVNTISAFAAAQQAVLGFNELPDSASKTFIYTGNCLNTMTMASLLVGGVGKSATAHIIQSAASVYADRGFKFYYADERQESGAPVASLINGEAHGKLYLELAEGKKQEVWLQTFIKGVGYKYFGS